MFLGVVLGTAGAVGVSAATTTLNVPQNGASLVELEDVVVAGNTEKASLPAFVNAYYVENWVIYNSSFLSDFYRLNDTEDEFNHEDGPGSVHDWEETYGLVPVAAPATWRVMLWTQANSNSPLAHHEGAVVEN